MATERIALTQPIESRNGSFAKDSYSSNCVFETRDQKREFVKRPGLISRAQVVPVTPPAMVPSQGLAGFNDSLIAVIDDEIYAINPSTYAVTTIGSTIPSTSQSYFVKTFLDAELFFHNKEMGYILNADNQLLSLANDVIFTVDIDNPGSGYSEGITLTFSSGTATAVPTVVGGEITSINITYPGTGYVSAPTCAIVKPSTKTPTGTGTSTEFTITVSDATGIYIGMDVTGTNVGSSAKVTAVNGLIVTVDVANAGAVSGTITFTDNGSGGSLTPTLNAFPAGPYVSGVVYLNNYIFLGTATNRIYSSAVGAPTDWSALDYVTFEQTADILVGIAKHLNYLIAFGAASIQFFYDAGTGIGSPLGLAQSYTSEIGCASGDSIVATSNTVLWIGTSKTYGRSVYIMDGVSPVRISTHNIDKHLAADSLEEVSAFCYTINGHTLYILTLHESNKTLVYDINEKMWYTWTQWAMASEDQPNPGTYYESYFRPTFYAQVNGVPYMLDDDTAELYQLDVDTYQDDGEDIYCRTVTDISDNGTTKRKFYGRLEIIGDKVVGTMQIRHTGDDYNTWSSYREVNLNASRSQVYLSGADRRRAWEFLVTSNCPLRLDSAEIDFRIGEMDQEQAVGGGRYRR